MDSIEQLRAERDAALARVEELENNISNESLKWHMKKLRETEERMLDEGDAFRTRVTELEGALREVLEIGTRNRRPDKEEAAAVDRARQVLEGRP